MHLYTVYNVTYAYMCILYELYVHIIFVPLVGFSISVCVCMWRVYMCDKVTISYIVPMAMSRKGCLEH